jgi:hypothetical protein
MQKILFNLDAGEWHLTPGETLFPPIWRELQDLGCSYEALRAVRTAMGAKDVLAVDVPADADIHAAYKIMQRGKKAGVWLFEEGHVGHTLPGSH